MIWFTSDTHFAHKKIIEYCDRPFSSVEEMDRAIINNWNSIVGKGDDIYHLGDFCFGDSSKYTRQLNGCIHLIPGSHDENTVGWCDPVVTIKTPIIDEVSGRHIRITMCHYAMRSWPLSHYASWHIYGHHHGKLPPYGLSFDVGVDAWNFSPISIFEIQRKMKELSPIVDFRKRTR